VVLLLYFVASTLSPWSRGFIAKLADFYSFRRQLMLLIYV